MAFKKIFSGVLICALCALCALSAYAESSSEDQYIDTYSWLSYNRQSYSGGSYSTPAGGSWSLFDVSNPASKSLNVTWANLNSYNYYILLAQSSSDSDLSSNILTLDTNYTYYFVFSLYTQNVVPNYLYEWDFLFPPDCVFCSDSIRNLNDGVVYNFSDYGGVVEDYFDYSIVNETLPDKLNHSVLRSWVISFRVGDSCPVDINGVGLKLSKDNLLMYNNNYPANNNYQFTFYISSLQSYYDPTGSGLDDDDNNDADDIIQGQIDAVNAGLDREREETTGDYNSAMDDNEAAAAALFNGESFISAFNGIVSAMSYTGTDFNFQFPALSFPYLENVSTDAQDIPLKFWIDQIPSGFLYALRMMGWLGLVFSIIHWVKKFIALFDGITDQTD